MLQKKKILWFIILVIGIWLVVPMSSSLDDRPSSYIVFSKNNELLGARIAEDGQWRFPHMDSVPYRFATAVIEFEDRDFYSHFGIDFSSVIRAIKQNMKEKKVVSGASTLTMQLMRLHYPKAKRNLIQKIKEVLFAVRYELFHSKEDILLDYCTHAPFGGNVVGMETASWRYFDKSPESLSWAEASMLAVLPNAPGLIHPGRNRDALNAKRDRLLKRLYDRNIIDSTEYVLSIAEPLIPSPENLKNIAPHLSEMIKKNAVKRSHTTIDKDIHMDVASIINEHHFLNKQKNIQNAAVIVIDNKTQSVLSYHGNTAGSDHENYNDMILRPRSTGSILKPLLYAMAIEDGLITPRQLVNDIPISINGFSPKNYNHQHYGAIPFDKVISKSLNVPSVNLLQEYNIDRFLLDLKSLGFTSFDNSADYYGLPLILGGGEVNLWELTQAYSYLADVLNTYTNENSRYNRYGVPILSVLQQSKQIKKEMSFEPNLISASSIWHMFKAMLEVERPSEDGQWEKFSSSKKIHWKTGTSYGNRDAWSIGVTPQYTVGVWVGNSDGEGQKDIIGVKSAGRLLFDIYNVLDVNEVFEMPYDDMTEVSICMASGHLASDHCIETYQDFVSNNSQETRFCPYHVPVFLNNQSGLLTYQDCVSSSDIIDTSWFVVSPEVIQYYKQYNPAYSPLPRLEASCIEYNDDAQQLAFIYPHENSSLFLPHNLYGEREKCIFKARHKDSNSKIYWHINDRFYTITEDIHEVALDLEYGDYIVTILDEAGLKQSRNISIINGD